jgi:hypothetical protein
MAIDPRDLKLKNGERAPVNRATMKRGTEWNAMRRRFEHQQLHDALAGFGIAKVRTR